MSQSAKLLLQNLIQTENKKIEFDLDNWITDFENGFLNYNKVNQSYEAGYWGQGIKGRPRIREINVEADAQQNEGYRVVEFFPNRDNNDESYLFFGTPFELRIQIALFMNLHIMLRGMDMGAWLGYPIDEYLRAKPRVGITLKVILTTYKNPPYYQNKKEWFSRRQVVIPNVDKSQVTFDAIRKACGGNTGQNWGEWTARAYLSNDSGLKGTHQMVCGGSTEKNAKENLKKFLKFTQCKVLRITANKIDYDEGNDKNNPDKTKLNSFNVYPAWISVLNNKLFPLSDLSKTGKTTLNGKQVGSKCKLFIYMPTEPSNWASDFNDVATKAW